MKAKTLHEPARLAARLAAYLALAAAVLMLYMIIPLMVALTPLLDDNQSRLFTALVILALCEIPVIAILRKTSLQPEGLAVQGERRRSLRVPADFEVGIKPISTVAGARLSSTAQVANASREGLAVLVEEDWPTEHSGYVSVLAYLPGKRATNVKARIVASEEMREDDRRRRLLRLSLMVMDHEDKQRYLRHLEELELRAAS